MKKQSVSEWFLVLVASKRCELWVGRLLGRRLRASCAPGRVEGRKGSERERCGVEGEAQPEMSFIGFGRL
jgi:hypothetical protein